MFRRSTNNPWIPPGGINSGYFSQIGGEDTAPVLALAGAGRFSGQLGQTVVHSTKTALQDSVRNPVTGVITPLFMGVYQLVKFAPVLTATGGNIQRGEIVYWDTNANNGVPLFQVTNTPSVTTGFRAGVVVNADQVVANAQGKFGYIQVAGLASMRYVAAVTSAIIGNLVVNPLTVNEVDAILDATAVTDLVFKTIVGVAYELPVNDGVLKVLMNMAGFYPNIG